MGYMRHEIIAVTTMLPLDGQHGVTQADVDAFRDRLPEGWRQLLIGPVESAINGYSTYAFLPDGSNEGWPHSDTGDEYRRQFQELFAFAFGDGSTPFDIVHIRFGGDEPHAEREPELIADNGRGLRIDSGKQAGED